MTPATYQHVLFVMAAGFSTHIGFYLGVVREVHRLRNKAPSCEDDIEIATGIAEAMPKGLVLYLVVLIPYLLAFREFLF